MSPAPTQRKIVPLNSVFAATISGPMPKFDKACSAIFSIDDAGPFQPISETTCEKPAARLYWED